MPEFRRGRLHSLLMLLGAVIGLSDCAARSSLPGNFAALSRAVIHSIPVGEGPIALALSHDGSLLYAAAADSKLSVISTASNAVTATVPIAPYPVGLVLSPDSSRAYITSLVSVKLTVVDTRALAALPSIDLLADQFSGGFGRLTLTPDGATAYLANGPTQSLAIVALATSAASSRLMDMRPADIAVAPDGRTLYVVGCKDFCVTGTIQIIDSESRQVTGSVSVGPRPYRIALSPDGKRAYTSNFGDPSVSVVDLVTGTVITTVPVSVQPRGLAVAPDGSRVFVTSQPTGTVTVIATGTNSVQATAKIAGQTYEVVVAPDGARLYVSTDTGVAVVDVKSLGG